MTTPVMKKQTKLHNCGVVVSPALLEGLRSDACGAVHPIASVDGLRAAQLLAKAAAHAAQPS